MYAVIQRGGKQYKVEVGEIVSMDKLDLTPGEKVVFDEVLMISQGKEVKIGQPLLKEARVIGRILEHYKGDKVIAFKMKRRKRYRRKVGHRQLLTKVAIEEIAAEKGGRAR